MENEKISITERAKRTIYDHELLVKKYGSVESVLRFLRNPTNFKSLSDLIQEVMVKSGACKEGFSIKECITTLKKLSKKRQVDLADFNIEHWLDGQSKTITRREDAIKICLALDLDDCETDDFLNKAGHHSFNFRSAEDATFLYCILNRERILNSNQNLYPIAKNILKKYYQSDSTSQAIKDAIFHAKVCDESHSIDELVSVLFALGKDYGLTKKKIQSWLLGVENITDIKDALRLCLSLKMDISAINDFLIRIGIHVFSIRMVYANNNCCFTINSRPYRIPCKDGFYASISDNNCENSNSIENRHSGNTTQVLVDEFWNNACWDDEESFITTFLLKNKKRFINCSYNAMKEYFIIKNRCLLLILLFAIDNEIQLTFDKETGASKKEIRFTKGLNNAINAFSENDVFGETLKRCKRRGLNEKQVLLILLKSQHKNDTFDFQLQLSEFLNYAISMERALTYTLDSIRKDGKPQDPLFTEIIENDAAKEKDSHERLSLERIEQIIINSLMDQTNTNKTPIEIINEKYSKRNTICKKMEYAVLLLFYVEHVDPEQIESLNNCDFDRITGALFDSNCPLPKEISQAIREYQDAKGFGRIRAYRDSSLSKTVLDDFPNKSTLSNVEIDPSVMYQSQSIRKTIMLMVYMIYAYENHISTEVKNSELSNSVSIDERDIELIQQDKDLSYLFMFGGINFKEFLKRMDTVLNECHLPLLYFANQFDYLIIRSAREFGKTGITFNEHSKTLLDDFFPGDKANEVDYERMYNIHEFSRQHEFDNDRVSPVAFLNSIIGESFDAVSVFQDEVFRFQIWDDSVIRFHFNPRSSLMFDFLIESNCLDSKFGKGLLEIHYIDTERGYLTDEGEDHLAFSLYCKQGQLYTFELQAFDMHYPAEIRITISEHFH